VDAEGVNAKAALRTGDILSMVHAIGEALDSPRSLRDRTVLLMGFTGGLRRSELASLKVKNLHFADEGVWVELERSKADQAGVGEEVSIHAAETPEHCPVRACREWLEAAGLEGDDYLFQSIDRWGNVGNGGLSGRSIANVVKNAAAEAGLAASKYSAHSLRSGFVTELMASGEGDSSIMQQTRHESAETLRKYDKGAARFRRDFTSALGL
jgi:site-specific recombinase XerD